MPDTPTPLDLDAIRAVLDRGVAATGGEWFHALRSCIDEVERLRAERELLAANPAPAWDEEAARAASQVLYERLTRIPEFARLDSHVQSDYSNTLARAALAVVREHLPVKPDREALSAALNGLKAEEWDACGEPLMRSALRDRVSAQADAVLNLWPGRSEAEVKAEALREAADAVTEIDGRADDDAARWLRARADRLAAEGGADRG